MASPESAWHMRRRRRILEYRPDLKTLFGHDPVTSLWVVGLVGLQLALCTWVANRSWPVVLLLAYFVGAFLNHALGVLIHECSHDLVFKKPWANKALSILANIPLAAPAAIEFRKQHILHHQHLGDADGKDTQAPTRAEVAWVGTSWWRKILSFSFGRFFYPSRPANKVPFDRWMTVNFVVVVGAMVVLVLALGWKPLVYLVGASLAGFGPHPTGARRLSEHLAVRPEQPSTSYYGILNRVSFNVGYHVEHHDFPLVPWTRVKKLRATVASHYDELSYVRSWSTLLLHHFFDKSFRVDHYVGMGAFLRETDVYLSAGEGRGDASSVA